MKHAHHGTTVAAILLLAALVACSGGMYEYRDPTGSQVSIVYPEAAPQAARVSVPPSEQSPRPAVSPRKQAYAVVIGIEEYRQRLPRADFARHDAAAVAEQLVRELGYPEAQVLTLTNDHAAFVDLVKYFEKWLPNNVEPGGEVFVYYSGHGAPNPKTGDAYLVPYDGDPSFIEETGYSLGRLYAALGKLPAREIVVVLDSCFSGAGGRSVIAQGARPLVLNPRSAAAPAANITVLAASSGEQISMSYAEKQHGLFTYFLLDALRGGAAVRADGALDVGALHARIRPQVESVARKQYNNEQTPQLLAGGQ